MRWSRHAWPPDLAALADPVSDLAATFAGVKRPPAAFSGTLSLSTAARHQSEAARQKRKPAAFSDVTFRDSRDVRDLR